MKTISLRTLVRETLKVKRMTRTGQPVQVTDNGEPLWILQPAYGTGADEKERRRAIDKIMDEVLREKPSKISLSRILDESRR
jgi:antitoxin (DNA-binding transcriptional repressor) of toxin-antitoxin stability system